MVIRAFPNPSGSRYWRLEHPFKYLRRKGHDAQVVDGGIKEEYFRYADIIVLQGCINKEGIALAHYFQQEHGVKIVVDQDDLVEVSDDNPHKKHHEVSQATEVIKITMGIADMVTTTQSRLADKLSGYTKHVRVIPNYIDLETWEAPYQENTSDRIRIGWAGSITHLEDLKLVTNVLKRLKKEYPIIEYVILGDLRFKDELPDAECMLGVPFDSWPQKLHGMRLDIGIAPLVKNDFNLCKSNIKWQEYAIAQIPGVYTSFAYDFRGFDSRLGIAVRTQEQWYQALKNLIICPPLRDDIKYSAYAYVKTHFNLEKRIYEWEDAYQSLLT
jgi:glycosyltransferase involved in cell wall biosynthesis